MNGHVEIKISSHFVMLTFFQSLSKLGNDIKYEHYSVDSHNTHESVKNSEKSCSKNKIKTPFPGASLVAQWLRICLLMQGTRVRALVWEDPTCRGATKPVSHNY